MIKKLRRWTMEEICWQLLGRSQGMLAGDIPFGRFYPGPSIQAVSNALRHGRRHGYIRSKLVGPGNRSRWFLTEAGRKVARNPADRGRG